MLIHDCYLFCRDKFSPQPFLKVQDDIVLDSMKNVNLKNAAKLENQENPQEHKLEKNSKDISSNVNAPVTDDYQKIKTNGDKPVLNGGISSEEKHSINIDHKDMNGLENIQEVDEDKIPVTPEPEDNSFQEMSEAESENMQEVNSAPAASNEVDGDVEVKDDDVIQELLNGDEASDLEEEKIIDSILSDSHEEDTVDER